MVARITCPDCKTATRWDADGWARCVRCSLEWEPRRGGARMRGVWQLGHDDVPGGYRESSGRGPLRATLAAPSKFVPGLLTAIAAAHAAAIAWRHPDLGVLASLVVPAGVALAAWLVWSRQLVGLVLDRGEASILLAGGARRRVGSFVALHVVGIGEQPALVLETTQGRTMVLSGGSRPELEALVRAITRASEPEPPPKMRAPSAETEPGDATSAAPASSTRRARVDDV